MANWKDRYKKLRAKAGGAGRKLASGAKDSAKTAGGGIVGALAAQMVAPHIPASIPYGGAGALAIAGHLVRRKYPHIGTGMLGAAGAFLALEFLQKNPGLAEKLPGANKSSASETKGFEGAGAFYGYGDAGALQEATGFYYEDAGAFQSVEGYGDGWG